MIARPFAALGLAMLLLGGCGGGCDSGRDLEACRKQCDQAGVVPGGRVCDTICKGDCDELAETYALSEEVCRRMQAGEN